MQAEEARAEFYTIPSGQLLAGNYPTAWDPDELREKMRSFLRQGVSFFLDLTEDGEALSYEELLEQEARRMGVPAGHMRFPIPDNDIPSPQRMTAMLDEIDSKIASGHRVYVHCLFGIGRTGTVFGCYLARHGLGGKQALKELVRLQKDTMFEGMTSPASQKQREMVENWPVDG